MHRTALALAAAGAVAATAITTAVLTGGDRPSREVLAPADETPSAAPTASPSPTRAPFDSAGGPWRTSIPDDLSVSAGLPEAGGDFERDSEPVTWTFCDTEAFPVKTALDARREGASGPEYGDRRDLRVFANDTAAHRFLRSAAEAATACPEELHGPTRWIYSVSPGSTGTKSGKQSGKESVRILQTYETDGLVNPGATWWDLTRVGNAVLLTATGGEYVAGQTLGRGIRDHQKLIAPIVESMCVFAASGCGGDRGDTIPANFPLEAGWPADSEAEPGRRYGLTGPNDTLPPLEFTYCGDDFIVSGGTDSLRADWTNVEDYRGRALLAFATQGEAAGFVADFTDSWTSCPRSPSGSGYVAVHDTRKTDLGEDSTALVSWTEFDGAPAIGLQVVHVVRVDSTVLVDTAANEGGGGPDREGAITDQVRHQGDALVAILDFDVPPSRRRVSTLRTGLWPRSCIRELARARLFTDDGC